MTDEANSSKDIVVREVGSEKAKAQLDRLALLTGTDHWEDNIRKMKTDGRKVKMGRRAVLVSSKYGDATKVSVVTHKDIDLGSYTNDGTEINNHQIRVRNEKVLARVGYNVVSGNGTSRESCTSLLTESGNWIWLGDDRKPTRISENLPSDVNNELFATTNVYTPNMEVLQADTESAISRYITMNPGVVSKIKAATPLPVQQQVDLAMCLKVEAGHHDDKFTVQERTLMKYGAVRQQQSLLPGRQG